MKFAVTFIRMDVSDLLNSSPFLEERLSRIYSREMRINAPSSTTPSPILEGMLLELLEQVLEHPVVAWIQRRNKLEPERALLSVTNDGHVLAIPLVSACVTVTNANGLAELLLLPEHVLHPCVEIMIGTQVVFESEFTIVTSDQRLEPVHLEPVDVIVVPHVKMSSISSTYEFESENLLALQENEACTLISIEVSSSFEKTLISGFYLPLDDFLAHVGGQAPKLVGQISVPLVLKGESAEKVVILSSVPRDEDLVAWT